MASKSLRTRNTCYWMVGVSLLALSGPTFAAGAGDAWLVEEITVTARKREESLIDVPISLSVVGALAVERSGVKDLENLSRTIPSVVVEQGSEQESKRFIIRGIGSSSGAASTTAVYIDDTPITVGIQSPDLNIFDIERMEVLRGPQGTLFGSSAMGGAIRYISPKPHYSEFSGVAKVETGLVNGGGKNFEAQGAVGGPIIEDSLAFRASAFYRRDGGYIDIVDELSGAVTEKDANSTNTYGGRVALAKKLGDHVEANLSLLYQDQKRNDLPLFFTGRGVTTTVPLGEFQRTERSEVGSRDKFLLPNLTLNVDLGSANLVSSTSYSRRKFEIDNDFSYFIQKTLRLPDPMGTPLVVATFNDRELEAFTQEVRLSSSHDGALQWQVGGYYSHSEVYRAQDVTSQNLGTIVPPLAGAILPGGVLYVSALNSTTKQIAGFGELSYALTDQLELTGGVRVTRLKLELERSANGFFNGGYSGVVGESKATPVTPKISLSYKPNSDAMVYATAAKGFREGGPNSPVPTGIAACATALSSLGLTQAPESYGSDNLWSYEVGGKFKTSDGRLQANLAAYYIDWSEIQQSITLSGGCGFGFTDNIGKAKSEGLEAEVTLHVVEGLSIELNGGYTNAKLTEPLITGANSAGPIVAAPKGTRLAYVPRWTGGAAVQYSFGIGGDMDAYVRGQVQYIGKTTRDLGTPSDDPRSHNRDSYEIASLRVAVKRDIYELSVFADNLFNAKPTLFETFQEFAPGSASERTSLRPRVIGVSLSARY